MAKKTKADLKRAATKAALIEFLKKAEGYNPVGKHINDHEAAAGIVTGGWGSTGRVGLDEAVDPKLAAEWLGGDADWALDRAHASLPASVMDGLNPNQAAALASLIYNLGATGFKQRKDGTPTNAYQALLAGDHATFLKEAFDPQIGFVRQGGNIINGLVNRRADERALWNGFRPLP